MVTKTDFFLTQLPTDLFFGNIFSGLIGTENNEMDYKNILSLSRTNKLFYDTTYLFITKNNNTPGHKHIITEYINKHNERALTLKERLRKTELRLQAYTCSDFLPFDYFTKMTNKSLANQRNELKKFPIINEFHGELTKDAETKFVVMHHLSAFQKGVVDFFSW
jgi:hypothetical protein